MRISSHNEGGSGDIKTLAEMLPPALWQDAMQITSANAVKIHTNIHVEYVQLTALTMNVHIVIYKYPQYTLQMLWTLRTVYE